MKMIESAEEILNLAMSFERHGIAYYSTFSDIVQDSNGKAILKFLANAEKEHEALLAKVKEGIGHVEMKQFVPTVDAWEVFPLEKIGEMEASEAIEVAIGVEEKSAQFYRESKEAVDDDGLKDLFDQLIGMEMEHHQLLSDNLSSLKAEGSWTGYHPMLEG